MKAQIAIVLSVASLISLIGFHPANAEKPKQQEPPVGRGTNGCGSDESCRRQLEKINKREGLPPICLPTQQCTGRKQLTRAQLEALVKDGKPVKTITPPATNPPAPATSSGGGSRIGKDGMNGGTERDEEGYTPTNNGGPGSENGSGTRIGK